MRHIDKSALRQSFDEYTRLYLSDSKSGDTRFYPELRSEESYSNFSHKKYKYQNIPGNAYNGWLEILMREHDGRCCYCMRRLSAREVSVEHLVPESFEGLDEESEMRFYESHAPYIRKFVMTGREFDEQAALGNVDISTHTRMPHLVAHGNLFPACNNRYGCSCNNHRHNFRILPMMLMEDVADWAKYSTDGTLELLHPDHEAAAMTLAYLDINSDTLVRIRRLWYLFSRKKTCPEHKEYGFADKDALLRVALDLDATEIIPDGFREFIQSDYYWALMLQYDWFFGYYLQEYPVA